MHFSCTKNIALCERYRVTAFFGGIHGEREDEFMRSIEVSRPLSTSNSGFFSADYDFIELDNTSYHARGDMSMNTFRMILPRVNSQLLECQ